MLRKDEILWLYKCTGQAKWAQNHLETYKKQLRSYKVMQT